MKADRRGLSTIVITLIIILISLVAVGIVWVVVRNLISTQGIEITAKCLNTNVEATVVNCSDVGVSRICDVQLMRTGTGSDAIGGVKLVFRDSVSGTSSSSISINGDVEKLVGKKQTGVNTTILSSVGVDTVEVTAFFKDSAGNDQICSQTNSFSNFS